MIKSTRKIYPIYLLVDLVLISAIFLFSYFLRYKNSIINKVDFPNFEEYIFIFSLWSMFIVRSFSRSGLYATDRSLTIPKEIIRVIISIFYSGVLMSAIIFFAQYKFFSRQVFLLSFIMLCIFLCSWRVLKRITLRKLIKEGFHNLNILIVGTGDTGRLLLEEVNSNPCWGFKIIGFLNGDEKEKIDNITVLGRFKDFPEIVKKYFIDEVIIIVPSQKNVVSELMKQAKEMQVGIRIIPENFEEPTPVLNISYLGVIPLITYKERRPHPSEFALKRVFDFALSLFLLIIFFPLFIIIAILIKLDSPGPVSYIHKRVGFKGRNFNLYKFRSMVLDADRLKYELLEKNEIKDGVIFKIKKDPRITGVGTFLRKYSLDELPQIFNVLKGDMSLVGPRPPTVEEVEKYNHMHMQRLSIRPGITCLSQIRGRSELTFRRWVKWDTWYVNNWSFSLDLKILWWTIPAVLKGKGAY